MKPFLLFQYAFEKDRGLSSASASQLDHADIVFESVSNLGGAIFQNLGFCPGWIILGLFRYFLEELRSRRVVKVLRVKIFRTIAEPLSDITDERVGR